MGTFDSYKLLKYNFKPLLHYFMPELPEVETTRQGIMPHIKQQKVSNVSVRQRSLRWPVTSRLGNALRDKTVCNIQRRSKYLLLIFNDGGLIIHLGMSGSLRISEPSIALRKHDHVILHFANQKELRFHDPRRFGCVLWHKGDVYQHKLLQNLGPEPLTDDFNAEHLYTLSRKRKMAIKNFIMQASIVVGVGNIYASESLFMSGIRPTRPAGKVTHKEFEKLSSNIKKVLEKSIKQGGTTLRDFVNGDGEPGYFKQSLFVYGRKDEVCKKCNNTIKQKVIGQRSSFYCPGCQR